MMTGAEMIKSSETRASQPPPTSPDLPGNGTHFTRQDPFTTSGPPVCTCCGQSILDQFVLQVQGQTWHSRCLRCCVCQCLLSYTCYTGNSQLYCQHDFFRLYGGLCSACHGVIHPSEVVRHAQDKLYHVTCFRCSSCRRELCTGDEFYLSLEGHLLCRTDFMAFKAKELGQDENANPEEELSRSREHRSKLLMNYFEQNCKPNKSMIEKIATELGLEPSTIRAWFRQRRAQEKRKGTNYENSEECDEIERVNAPLGGCPLPIVNKALSPGQLPTQAANHFATSTAQPLTSSLTPMTSMNQWSVWEDIWSSSFIPPNVDLLPEQIKDGEVVMNQQTDPQGQGLDILHRGQNQSHNLLDIGQDQSQGHAPALTHLSNNYEDKSGLAVVPSSGLLPPPLPHNQQQHPPSSLSGHFHKHQQLHHTHQHQQQQTEHLNHHHHQQQHRQHLHQSVQNGSQTLTCWVT